MNILMVKSDFSDYSGSVLSMSLGAKAIQEKGHQVYWLHRAGSKTLTIENFDGSFAAHQVFDRTAYFDKPALRKEEREIDRFIQHHNIKLIHVEGWPRTSTLRRWTRKYSVVASVRVALCPNNARYQWANRSACDRPIGISCYTTGYRKLGCGHLGNGKPYSTPAFLRSMVEDHALRNALKHCKGIVTPSSWMKERLAKDNLPYDKIHVLNPPIVDVDLGCQSQSALPSPDLPVLTFVGRLTNFKGVDHLLQASAQIEQPHQVWIIGDGEFRGELEEIARHLNITDRVTFWGSCEPTKVRELQRQSTAIIVPSLWPEAFGRVGPEAMLLGKPVVGYNVGGISDWLKDSSTGKLVTAGDMAGLAQAITELIENPNRAKQMGEAGRQYAQQWVVDRYGEKLIDLYQKVIIS